MAGGDAAVALLVIGNEILSGRTREKNLRHLAALLKPQGLQVGEVRVVRDETDAIVTAVNALRQRYGFVFTSGGIGPTHDDITAAAIATAFDEALVENAQAVEVLQAYFDSRRMQLTPARRRMAQMPASAKVVDSDFPGAPGFCVGNVFVCAGVPEIFELMASAAIAQFLPQRAPLLTQSVYVYAGESQFAEGLAAVATAAGSGVEIGSYPKPGHCHITFSGSNEVAIAAARQQFCTHLIARKIDHKDGESEDV